MSTRSVVAIPAGDGWQGRYVHFDGYPEGRVPVLLALIQRDGLEKVIQTVIHDHYGWSYLDPEQGDDLINTYRDGRFIAVPGYGVAYTKEQAGADEWMTDTSSDPLWIEYAYVLGGRALTILEGDYQAGRFTLLRTGQYISEMAGV